MRITDVEVLRLSIPLSGEGFRPAWAPGTQSRSWPCCVVRVRTDEGLVGYGGQKYWNPTLDSVIRRILVEELCNPMHVGKFSDMVDSLRSTYGDRFCGFEVALWDVVGKKAEKSVHLFHFFQEHLSRRGQFPFPYLDLCEVAQQVQASLGQ